jgi:hypothetical protein
MTSPSDRNSPTPPEKLRDARLAHALKHMPDAHMQPNSQTRSAVLQEAARALASTRPAVPGSVLRRWWHALAGQPGRRVPWSAAFASLAIVSFITVLWYGREVPDAAPENSPVVRPQAADDTAVARSAPGKEVKAPATVVAQAPVRAEARPAAPSAAPPERRLAQSPAPLARQTAPAAAQAPATDDANVAVAAAEARLDSASKARVAPADQPQAHEAVPFSAGAPLSAPALAAAPVQALADTSSQQRDRADTAARAQAGAATRMTLTISLGDVKRSVRPEEAQPLLGLLRGLPYGSAPSLSKRVESEAELVVEIAGQERWVIAPGHVIHQILGASAGGALAGAGDTPGHSDVTPAQYATLRRLAMEIGSQQ